LYSILIGNAGYLLHPWLITPFKDPLLESPEERFNNVFVVQDLERVNGIFLMRFYYLLKHCVSYYIIRQPLQQKLLIHVLFSTMAIKDGLHFPEKAADILINNPKFGFSMTKTLMK